MKNQMVAEVRKISPIIHCITNYVTVNDMANMLLAAGGSPIMADGFHEVEDITDICQGLVLNIGTLQERTLPSMLSAGQKAGRLKHPVIFDPVGVGASKFRTEAADRILKEVSCSVIRGNASEIKMLALGSGTIQGVDADRRDAVTEVNLPEAIAFAKQFSKATGAVIVITGAIDLITDAEQTYIVRNGHSMMSRVTGTGCMLDGVIAAYAAAHPKQLTKAVAMAVAAEGICGEIAYRKVEMDGSGTSSFRMHLIDAMSNLNDHQLNGGAKIEIRSTFTAVVCSNRQSVDRPSNTEAAD